MDQLALIVNPSATPVPWGPLILASLATAAGPVPIRINFDPESTALALTSRTKTVAADSIDIIEKIAKSAGLPNGDSKVCCIVPLILSIDF